MRAHLVRFHMLSGRLAAVALSWVIVLTAMLSAGAAPTASATGSFVERAGSQLTLNGRPYEFRGLNVYNANSHGWCWYGMNSGSVLDEALAAHGAGKNMIRAWFFQPLAQPTPDAQVQVRTWDAFDNTLATADAHGMKVVVTLTDQWGECGDGGTNGFKGQDWYETGYREVQPGMLVSYRDYVQEVVTRYGDDPRIAFWQLINEAEVTPVIDGVVQPCPGGQQQADILKAWAADMASLVKSIDPNHLVSLGSIGGGQCGMQGEQYQYVHDLDDIDLCEYHDYTATEPMPGDQWNGLQVRLDQCAALNKPLFVGEVGIIPNDVGGTLQDRADALAAKIEAQSAAGVQGFLAWAWNSHGIGDPASYDIGPGDPLLDVLALADEPPPGTWDGMAGLRFTASATGNHGTTLDYAFTCTPGDHSRLWYEATAVGSLGPGSRFTERAQITVFGMDDGGGAHEIDDGVWISDQSGPVVHFHAHFSLQVGDVTVNGTRWVQEEFPADSGVGGCGDHRTDDQGTPVPMEESAFHWFRGDVATTYELVAETPDGTFLERGVGTVSIAVFDQVFETGAVRNGEYATEFGPSSGLDPVPTPPTGIQRVTPVEAGISHLWVQWMSDSRLAHVRSVNRIDLARTPRTNRLHAIDLDGSNSWTGPEVEPNQSLFDYSPINEHFIYLRNRFISPTPNAQTVMASTVEGPERIVAGPSTAIPILWDTAFSPDGQRFWLMGGTNAQPRHEIRRMDGTLEASIGPAPQSTTGFLHGPAAFSPDGSEIAISRGREVLVAAVDGSTSRIIASDPDLLDGGEIAWSPDGSVIAVADHTGLVFLDPESTAPYEECDDSSCWMVPGTGAGPRKILSDHVNTPRWSPDGRRLAVVRTPAGSQGSEIALVPADGGAFSTLVSLPGSEVLRPEWSPDGSMIAFTSDFSSPLKVSEGRSDYSSLSVYVAQVPPLPPENPDADGDGVHDSIGTGNGGFDDGAGTFGAILDSAGHDVLVAPDPDGVRITVEGSGTEKATFTVCGFTLRFAPGSEIVVSCGSITVRVLSGAAEVELGDGLTVISVPAGVTAHLSEDGSGGFTLDHVDGDEPIGIVVGGVSSTLAPGRSTALQTWQFIGFGAPVDNDGVLNVVKAGQSVPLKWRLVDASGQPVTTLAAASVSVAPLACSAGGSEDKLDETAAGHSALQSLGNGYYQLNWKTPKSYANSCKTLRLDVGDGVLHTALFKFTR